MNDDDELPSVDHLLRKFVSLKEYRLCREDPASAMPGVRGKDDERRKVPEMSDSCDKYRASLAAELPVVAVTSTLSPSAVEHPVRPPSPFFLRVAFVNLVLQDSKEAILTKLAAADSRATPSGRVNAVFIPQYDLCGDGDPSDFGPGWMQAMNENCALHCRVVEAILQGHPPVDGASHLNLPLGTTLEVFDDAMCDVLQGALRLGTSELQCYAMPTTSSCRNFVDFFANKHANLSVSSLHPLEDVPDQTPLSPMLREMGFTGIVLDHVGGPAPAVAHLARLHSSHYPVAPHGVEIDRTGLLGLGVTHFVAGNHLYCGGVREADLPAARPYVEGEDRTCYHRQHFVHEEDVGDGWTRYSTCSSQTALSALHLPERAARLRRLRELHGGLVTKHLLATYDYV